MTFPKSKKELSERNVYDKISAGALIGKLLRNLECAKNVHKNYDKIIQSGKNNKLKITSDYLLW